MDTLSNALSDAHDCLFDYVIYNKDFCHLAWLVLLDTQINDRKYELAQCMLFEEPSITRVPFDTQVNSLKYQFTQGMWLEDPSMTNVLFDT